MLLFQGKQLSSFFFLSLVASILFCDAANTLQLVRMLQKFIQAVAAGNTVVMLKLYHWSIKTTKKERKKKKEKKKKEKKKKEKKKKEKKRKKRKKEKKKKDAVVA